MRPLHTTLIGAACALALTACGSSGEEESTESAAAGEQVSLVSPGSLTVCTDVPYEPFDYVEDGEFTGFDLDLMRAIAKGMDLQMEVKDMGFDGIQSGAALNAGQCDVAAGAMTITEDRKKNLAFTQPYYDSKQSLLVPSDSDISSMEDLSGKKLGVQQGTTGEDYARDNTPEGTELVSFDGEATLYQALQAGGVDGVLQDLPVNVRHTEDGGRGLRDRQGVRHR